MKKDLLNSPIGAMFSKNLLEEKDINFPHQQIDKLTDIIFTSIANILKLSKQKNCSKAFVIRNIDNTFIFGAVVQYFENKTDKKNPGNWSLVFTFNEEDIPKDSAIIEFSKPDTHSYFIGRGQNKYGMRFESEASLTGSIITYFTSLKKWLDENVSETEEVIIEHEGYFQARCKVENGEKVFAIEPIGEIKNIIKDDADIE